MSRRASVTTALVFGRKTLKILIYIPMWHSSTPEWGMQDRIPRIRLPRRKWELNALVVASGHYNLPPISDTPGLAEWKRHIGDHTIHTKQYRHPRMFRGKTVLVVGRGALAYDVCREARETANKVIQSTRGGDIDLPPSFCPDSVKHVGAIEEFVLDRR
ncbi:hypothetical protein FZEAL_5076 [Fusarium zealandicum]|uniref:FAD/NAD(P)-binding domain-containing protein n=1 Tax=Fusarium zealandicum TaxID=1053134 RepID=A0A8H4UL64_9HYPO|nr:hypothetical protein FZEAL_5076 [Fusarium zealandicum]